MPRSRSPNRDIAKDMYLKAKGDIKLKDIADTLGVLDTQVRKWKNQDKWEDELKGALPKQKDTERIKSNVAKKRSGTIVGITKNKVEEIIENIKKADLNDKQRLFCIYYSKTFNATKAYQKAYDCAYETAMVNGCNLLSKPKIKAEIEKIKDSRLAGALLGKEDILQKYIDIAFANMNDFLDYGYEEQIIGYSKEGLPIMGEDNFMRFKNDMDGTLVSEIKSSRQGASIKLFDKMKALEWLSNFFEMNPEFKHKREMDYKKLQIERERFEHVKEVDKNNNW
jgi:phage terminase small subunit